MSDKLCVCGLSNATVGSVVLHTDHLAALAAASAYDEEKERALFEAELVKHQYCVRRDGLGDYINEPTARKWQGWLACAKARAKAFTTSENK